MYTTEKLSKFLYFFTSTLTVIASLIAVYFFSMSILAMFNFLPKHMNISIEMPVRLQKINDFYEVKALNHNFDKVRVEVEDARLKAQPTDSKFLQSLGYLVATTYTVFFAFILYQLKKIFDTFRKKEPFDSQNTRNIRLIGVFTIGLAIFELLVHIIFSMMFNGMFSITNAEFIDGYFLNKINFIALFSGLIIIALSEVFKEGVILQENENLTV